MRLICSLRTLLFTSDRFNIINSGNCGIWSVSYGGFVATGLGVLIFYFAIVHLKKQ